MSVPLQQEIGRTEQALSALLLEIVLKDGSIVSNDEWVAVNMLLRDRPGSLDQWHAAIAESLTAAPERVVRATSRLIDAGVVSVGSQGLDLSAQVEQELTVARRKTAYVSAEIDRKLSVTDRAATVRTLALVRDVVRTIREQGFATEAPV